MPKRPRTPESPQKLDWKRWNSKLFCEVFPDEHPVDPIFIDTMPLLTYVKANRVMFIQGSPACGKSSLARLIKKEAVTKGFYNEVCNPYSNESAVLTVDSKQQSLENAGEKDSCLFIIDDAQSQLALKFINPGVMYSAGLHVMYFGNTSQTTDDFKTPAELVPHKYWMHAPSVDRHTVRDFAVRVLEYHGAELKEASRLAEQLFDYAGASMGVLMHLLYAIVEGKGKFPFPREMLLNVMYQSRVVMNGESVWEYHSSKIAIAKELLAVGQVTVDADNWTEEKKPWLFRGFVRPLRDLARDKAIVATDTTSFCWAHAWQRSYCRMRKERIEPRRKEWLSKARLRAPIDGLLRFLSSFDIETLVPNIVNGIRSLNALEYDFQSELRLAIERSLPEVSICQTPTKGTAGLRGRLNFMLELKSQATVATVCWGYDLIVRGKDEPLNTGTSWFAHSAKKSDELAWSDHLLLDCHTEPLRNEDANGSAEVARISPHQAEGWNVIVLDYRGKRLNIRRDGVPRYVADWNTATPEALVAVELFDPAHNVLLHFGTSTDKLVRVPHDAERRRIVAHIIGDLFFLDELRDKTSTTDFEFYTTLTKEGHVRDNEPVVDPMVDRKTIHYHVFVK